MSSRRRPEHFDAGGARRDGTEIERSPLRSFAAANPNDGHADEPDLVLAPPDQPERPRPAARWRVRCCIAASPNRTFLHRAA